MCRDHLPLCSSTRVRRHEWLWLPAARSAGVQTPVDSLLSLLGTTREGLGSARGSVLAFCRGRC